MPQSSARLPVLVCAPQAGPLAELRRALEGGGYETVGQLLGSDAPPACALAVLDDSGPACARLRARFDGRFVPIVVVTDGDRRAAFEAGADACLARPVVAAELLGQVAALLRVRESHDRLAEKAAEAQRLHKRLQQAYRQIDQGLELAQRLRAGFLPPALPEVAQARFAVHCLPCGRVGGDFYDVFRLDERHVGFYVADAMGHGVPASLLTVFVQNGLRAKEVSGREYRLVPPDEVLARLNRDLIDQRLSEQPFLGMVYGLYNHDDGTLQVARAGHLDPLSVPREGEVRLWRQEGLLLGVADARYPCQSRRLAPGDKVLLYSDGVDGATTEGLLACAARHRDLPAQEFVARLARDLFGARTLADDLTLLALERIV